MTRVGGSIRWLRWVGGCWMKQCARGGWSEAQRAGRGEASGGCVRARRNWVGSWQVSWGTWRARECWGGARVRRSWGGARVLARAVGAGPPALSVRLCSNSATSPLRQSHSVACLSWVRARKRPHARGARPVQRDMRPAARGGAGVGLQAFLLARVRMCVGMREYMTIGES